MRPINWNRRAALSAIGLGGLSVAAASPAKSAASRNETVVRQYLKAIGEFDGNTVARIQASDYVLEERPNLLNPTGRTAHRDQSLAAFETGKKILSDQRYDVSRLHVAGDVVFVELTWTGHLKEAFGKYPAGMTMTAECAIVLTLRDGQIVSQHEYDCFHPLG